MDRVVTGTSFIAFVTHSCLSEKLADQPQHRKRAIKTYVDNVGPDLCMFIRSLVLHILNRKLELPINRQLSARLNSVLVVRICFFKNV